MPDVTTTVTNTPGSDVTGPPGGDPSRDRIRKGLLRSTLVVSSLTVLSRVTGLVREQVRGYYLGTGDASDAFTIASSIPNMLRRLFAEGAMTAAFVPVFTGLQDDGDRARLSRFFSGFMTLFVLLMIGVTLLGVLVAEPLVVHVFAGRFHEIPGKVDLTVGLTRVMFPYLLLVSVAAILQGTLNSFRIFGPSAFTPVLLNLINIGAVIAFWRYFPNPAWALAVGFLAGGVVQMAFQIPYLRRQGIRFRPMLTGWRDPAVREVGRIFVPGIFSAGIYTINVTISEVIATRLEPGSAAALQYSLRLQELVLGVFAVSVATVILPTMSQQAHRKDMAALKDTLLFSIGLLGFVTIPATIGLLLLGEPLVRLLFQFGQFGAESTRMTSFALYFHAAGIFFIAMQRNVVQVFYSMKDLKTPTIVAGVVMVAHVLLCLALAVPLRLGGVALAGSIAAAFNVLALYWLLRRRIGRLDTRRLLRSLGRTAAASAAMAAVIAIPRVAGVFDTASRAATIGWMVVVIGAAGAVYLVASRALGSEELGEFVRLVGARLRRRQDAG